MIEAFAAASESGVVAIPSGRYFGFVIGGALPAALAADWLTSAWDQNSGLVVGGPAAAVAEETAGHWLVELLGLPPRSSFAFVTGCQMAHVTSLAAARHEVLERAGWDVENRGLAGSPPIRIVVGGKRHVTVDRALRLLGLGRDTVVSAVVDDQGRTSAGAVAAALEGHDGPAIVCTQVGEVNTGSIDPVGEIADALAGSGAWVHVDGAFGLGRQLSRAPAARRRRRARDSWATDAQVAQRAVRLRARVRQGSAPHRAAMAMTAEYLVADEAGAAWDAMDWTPEFSRRARGLTVYAALRSLGRSGVAELIERCCRHARRFSEELVRLPGARS